MLDVSDVVGDLGWYHAAVGALTVLRAFPTSWTLLVVPFIVPDVEHWCSKPQVSPFVNWTESEWKQTAIPLLNGSRGLEYDSCNAYAVLDETSGLLDENTIEPCQSWTYNESTPGSSAVPEWDLVCSSDWQRSAMQSVVFVGSLVGALLIGLLSDRFGRRFMFFASTFAVIVFGSAAGGSPSVTVFNALRFCSSMCIAGIQTTSAALFTEVVHARHRMLLNVGFSLGFTLPTLLLPGLAYLLGSWKYLQLSAGLCGILLLPFMLIVQESPRWLISRHKENEARRAIEKILKVNRRVIPDMKHVLKELVEKAKHDAHLTSAGPAEILRHSRLRANMAYLFVIWFCDNFFMYATALSSVDIGGSPFINFALSAAAEIPAGLVSFPVVRYCMRRRSQSAFLLLAGVAAIATSLLPLDDFWLRLSLNMACRFILVISAAVKWVYTMEIFPTAARGFGFSCCFTMGRIGGIIAPFMRDLGKHVHFTAPSLAMGAAGVIGAACACFLPETQGAALPDTFEEADALGTNRSRRYNIKLDDNDAKIENFSTDAV